MEGDQIDNYIQPPLTMEDHDGPSEGEIAAGDTIVAVGERAKPENFQAGAHRWFGKWWSPARFIAVNTRPRLLRGAAPTICPDGFYEKSGPGGKLAKKIPYWHQPVLPEMIKSGNHFSLIF